MPSETIQPFGHLTFKSETHDTSKSSPVSTKESDKGTTFILHCKSEPDSFYESTMLGKSVTSPQTGDSENGLLVSGPVGGNLMLYMSDEGNNKNEIVIMDDHSTFNPSSPDAPSPMSTTCSQSSMYSPSSPSVSMGVPSPSCMTSGENSCDVMLFDEDTISSLASILEESDNDMRTSSDERTLKCPRTSLTQVHSPEARVPSSPRTNLNQQCVFNFGLATSNTQFIETNFSSATSVTNQLSTSTTRSSTRSSRTKKPAATTQNNTDSLVPQRKPTRTRAKKTQSLNVSLPSKQNDLELSIVVQPEKQHRARYLTEGSRGSVKDESQQGFPTLRLRGTREQVTLQVFVASDLPNRVRPHGYYQACKVTGRNTTPCTELDVEGTTVIEIQWKPNEDNAEMEIKLDCVGILKLRNADVEQRIGLTRAKRKNTAVRLVYRVLMDRPDGSQLTLQQMSSAICCTQPLGHPEIIKKSLSRCSVQGKDELFIIGKNFVNKHTCVKLQEVDASGTVTWEEECEVDKSLFHNTHIVCTTPKFRTTSLEEDAEVYLVVSSGPGKTSEQYGHPMYYYMPLAGNTMDNNNFVGSSSAIDGTDSEGSLQFGLTSLQMPPSQETTMESSLTAMDVLNNFGQETIEQLQAVTTSPPTAAAQLDTSQMQLTMAQLQPVMTACVQLPTSQPATTLVQQVQTPAVTTTQSTMQLEDLTSGLTQVTSSAQVQPTTFSSLLTPAHSPKPATVTMDALSQFVQVSTPQPIVQVSAPQPVVTSSPTFQMSPAVQQQQQLLQQIQQQQQLQHQQQQSQLLPAETLLQAAQSLQALQAQAVQMQALQPQVQAAAMQVSAQLQMHAAKLQEQLKQKEQQQVVQNQPQQMSQVGVSFADKLKAAAQMEVSQPGLLTKLAQQQQQQQQSPMTLNLPSVCSVLNIQ